MSATSDLSGASTPLTEGQGRELEQAWRQFGSADSPEDFCRSWLALQCQIIGGVNAAVLILQKPGTEVFAPLAFWPESAKDRSHLAEIAERALREGRGIVQARAQPSEGELLPDQPDYLLAYPLRVDGRLRGVVALDIVWRDEAQLQAVMRQLQWGAGWQEVLLRRHADPMEMARQRMRLILQLVAIFLDRGQLGEAAGALVTELATQQGCDRVVLALFRQGVLRIEAVSHTAQFDPQSNLLTATVAAMMEAVDQKASIVYPPLPGGDLMVTLAHADLAALTGAGGVATIVLSHRGEILGALAMERVAGYPFDAQSLELLDGLAALLGPLIALQKNRQRSLPAHTVDSVRGFWQRLVGPREAGLKLAAVLAGVAILVLAFGTGDYRVSAEARIEGEIQRALTAPFPGYVLEANRRAGDTVEKGDQIARLDDRDLGVERLRLAAQRDQAAQTFREAMAKRERAQVRIASAQIAQAEAQLALVEEQIGRARLQAPFSGIIVSGDLSQSLGAPVERGQVLFEVAPLDAYRVVMLVDEQQVADVRPSQKGELVLASIPGSRYPFTVRTVTPVNTAKEGRNLFRVEGLLESQPDGRLRPGMEGVAKVSVDERNLLWIWTREFTTWLRHRIWAWTP